MDPADIDKMNRFRPTWWHRLLTWPMSRWHRGMFSQLKQFVLFVGYPRTGHSMIGSLLNAHRHGLIAHELNVMHHVKRKFNRDQLCWMLWQQDQAFERIGRNWTDYDYRIPGQWQGRWEELRFIGDKQAHGASKVLSQRPELIDQLQDRMGIPVRLIHIVRHPLDTISTMTRRNTQGYPLQWCFDEYLTLCETNRQLCERYRDSLITLHLEDFISQPHQTFSRLTEFLEIETDPTYMDACCSIIRPRESRTRGLIEWPGELLAQLASRQSEFEFLNRYRDQTPGAVAPLTRAA